MEQLKLLYKELYGIHPTILNPLPIAGSNRKYYRLGRAEGEWCIGVIGVSVQENDAFIYLSDKFLKNGLPVPEILNVSQDRLRYLQTDLGNTSLFEALKDGRVHQGDYSQDEVEYLLKTIKLLPHFQVEGAKKIDFSRCLSPKSFNKESILFDLNYFKYCFLKTVDIEYDEVLLQKDFEEFAEYLENLGEHYFMYRDFQARNIMLKDGFPYFIDFQGGMKGPLQYDVASFVWQASAHYSSGLRKILIDSYLDELEKLLPIERTVFQERLRVFVFFRLMQVLGAYGLRGYFERKSHFLESIPPAIKNLSDILNLNTANDWPYLENVLQRLVSLSQFKPSLCSNNKNLIKPFSGCCLTVRIYSFSYKKGIPEDLSGNGGGYVFDCRSAHNPGKYERYKQMTGLDDPVIEFLEKDGEIVSFLKNVFPLVDFHVQRFIERGFTDLMVAFGCTGGQHRSVYCAEHLAAHLHEKYPVNIILCHREQHIQRNYAADGFSQT